MRVLLLVAALAAPAAALPPPDEAGLIYGHALPAPNGSRRLGQRYSLLAGTARWPVGPAAVRVETRAGGFHRPAGAGLAGLTLGLEARPLPWLAVEGGVGSLWTDFIGLEMRYNFSLFAGAALLVPLKGPLSLRLGYRFEHFSNAGLRRPNAGLNGHVPYFGISIRLPSR